MYVTSFLSLGVSCDSMKIYIFFKNDTSDNKGKLGLKYLTNKIWIYVITNKNAGRKRNFNLLIE